MATDIQDIILIDDEDDCNFVTKLVLQRCGFAGDLNCFTSAQEALEYLVTTGSAPDLLFVDINMPVMTGFEFMEACERLGVLPNGRSSVVMFSSSNRPCDMEQAKRYPGVIGYVEKALSVDAYHEMARIHAEKRSTNSDLRP